ncbi:MAG: phosphoribosylformylglycinamidine synthase [Clostridiales bacterium]|nr:phosphoribosylformylglycinamidine synthase [Clostridiales bacterium]MDO4349291.1 phosphoribosylformylglycinamidine synthase [Eubacteriales bacterium]MDY4007564.1 phosphoribosylformylglycinamidine synthase [Candidatus Limiplasma sp.]
MAVYRVYVEKKPEYAVEAQGLLKEIRHILLIKSVTGVRVLNRYDVEGIDRALFERCMPIVFSEPQVDVTHDALPEGADAVIASEYLPGQFDARAASCEECIQLVSQCERPTVRTARVYLLEGAPSAEELARIRKHLINPVESREADLAEKQTLQQQYDAPQTVETLLGFTAMDDAALAAFVAKYGLAMDTDDLAFCREYFKTEGRDPTLTEIRMIDTYWSDHCRHTTFLTTLDGAQIEKPAVERAFKRYLALRETVYAGREGGPKPINLMDIATIGAKALKKQGKLPNLDESEEINACSIKIDVDVAGRKEPWLLMFKNETHNHPTEIEPFGGAATCIGGAIRDPLSGRTYVYQAMRVTGAADPLTPVTMPGKLPQRKLVTTAAAGYSAYGNQIGLATGLVDEVYHPGYAAKRLEIGAVVGAAPERNVRRERPVPGDVIVLLGGRTGRDGCGGATGSSKSHKLESIETCGAEVQKGNPVVERKLQRLFRDGRVTRLIKRCNDFGAGGVSVAIGELADGLQIDLDKVPKKYEGLDGTELAISESQERMAVVVAPQDAEAFIRYANAENLEATVVARVTEEPRLRMTWKGRAIVDLSREFLNSNGAEKHANVRVPDARVKNVSFDGVTFAEKLESLVGDLNICSKKGLSERFDSTIGAGTVLMPFGGRCQLTPNQAMVAKLPVLEGETTTVSGMSYGFHPQVMAQSPYEGAYLSVVESLMKLGAAGLNTTRAYLTFQEYFERMTGAPERWGKPFAALLGALDAQLDYGVAAIGGKDSMSGTFETLDVPPTLVSFAIAPGDSGDIISPEFKGAGHTLCLLRADAFDAEGVKQNLRSLYEAIKAGKVLSAWALGLGGVAEGAFKMALGNRIGAQLENLKDPFRQDFGAVLLEMAPGETLGEIVGRTLEEYALCYGGERVALDAMQEVYEGKLEKVFPYRGEGERVEAVTMAANSWPKPAVLTKKPAAFIPAFPGTNCEVDTARALARAGAEPHVLLINNLTPAAIGESLREAVRMIGESQMIVLPGGFSGGDEPDGSAKFITAFFRNPMMKDAVHELLKARDGLMLGICNGFQALVKLGLVPYGEIIDVDETCPTLTFNTIGRHQSMLVRTRVASNKSPWLQKVRAGDIHTIAISHGEGRFVASPAVVEELKRGGQIATQYVDLDGAPTMDLRYNPNGSVLAIEGVTSLDGRVLGKMGHSERAGADLYKNVQGNCFQPIFEGGVAYFR